jgi:pheromone shutdown-related protein TraB
MSELSGYLPAVKKTLIDERDQYLAAKIYAGVSGGSGPVKAAAVVGAGHLHGIKSHLEKIAAGEESADVTALDVIPKPGFLSKATGWLVPAIIVALIAVSFFCFDPKEGWEVLLRWLLWNGSLAAFGTIVALGHPLSILVAFLGAPIATLNPFIGVGLFSGVVEATMRKPRVSDTQTISEDVTSLKGIYRNRITRALLVFFLSTLGGAIGNFISIPTAFARLLGK